jgi:hypothetical protein
MRFAGEVFGLTPSRIRLVRPVVRASVRNAGFHGWMRSSGSLRSRPSA